MYIAIAAFIGFALDAVIGDPQGFPHPIIALGKFIAVLERALRRVFPKSPRGEFAGGVALWVIVCGLSFGVTLGVMIIARRISFWLWLALEAWFAFRLLAAKSLKRESMAVYYALQSGDISLARERVGRIVGRDTENLSESEIVKAAVETVAENTTDGVVSPLLYFLIGGAPLCFLFKAASTLDSTVGYKNVKYRDFGRFSARADDVLNFVPARVSGLLMVAAAWFCGEDTRGALRIFLRDRLGHASPNSAQTEAAAAGALGIRLGGVAVYSGEFYAKPTIGDDARAPVADDIRRANRLMYVTSVLALVIFCGLRVAIYLAI